MTRLYVGITQALLRADPLLQHESREGDKRDQSCVECAAQRARVA
jgi:hypothetical protein